MWLRRRAGCVTGWLAFALAVASASPLVLAYLGTHPPRVPLHTLPSDFGLPFETLVFRSRDGLALGGWLVPCRRPKGVVVLCHGHPANRCETLWLANRLHRRGFVCFLFDFRTMGVSEGAASTVGALETADLLGAVDLLSGRAELRDLPIAAYGMSMGGAVCLRAAAGDTRIRGVAAHGSYATLAGAVERRACSWLGPAGPYVARSALALGPIWASADLRHVEPLAAVGRLAPRPVLLMVGRFDRTAPPSDARRLQSACRGACDVVVLPRSTHAWIAPSDVGRAERSLIGFFQRVVAATESRRGQHAASGASEKAGPEAVARTVRSRNTASPSAEGAVRSRSHTSTSGSTAPASRARVNARRAVRSRAVCVADCRSRVRTRRSVRCTTKPAAASARMTASSRTT
ncbi:MAG: alpha/beta fold hydrolase, partial [Armatimonadetes bacterium]|nr:alpha/beta fold hydrolase [Armatimonadota bacterium]